MPGERGRAAAAATLSGHATWQGHRVTQERPLPIRNMSSRTCRRLKAAKMAAYCDAPTGAVLTGCKLPLECRGTGRCRATKRQQNASILPPNASRRQSQSDRSPPDGARSRPADGPSQTITLIRQRSKFASSSGMPTREEIHARNSE